MFLELLTLRMSITDSWITRAARSLDVFTRRDPVERHPMAEPAMLGATTAAKAPSVTSQQHLIADTMALPVVSAAQGTATAVKTLAVEAPTDELAAEIDDAMNGAMFTAEDMAQAVKAACAAPATTTEAIADDLPDLASTMALSKLTLLPEGDEPQPVGTFIDAVLFEGCTDEECGACGSPEDGLTIVMSFIPDDDEDRSVCTIELRPEMRVRLTR